MILCYPSCRPYVTPDCILRMGTVQYCTAIVDKTKDYNDHYGIYYLLYLLARTTVYKPFIIYTCWLVRADDM